MADSGWRIDRKIPVAVIVTLLLQTFGVVIWGTRLDSRVSYLEMNDLDTKKAVTQFAVLSEKMTQVQANSSETKQDIGSVRADIGNMKDIQAAMKQDLLSLKEEIRRSGFNGKR